MKLPRVIDGHMPGWLKGSRFEEPARRAARSVKALVRRVERLLRRGRLRRRLPSVEDRLWLDFDFAALHPLPLEDPLLAALVAHLRPCDVFYDVGSFVGSYAVAAARRLDAGRVVAFEPAPQSAQLLRHHCLLNGVDGRVRVVEAACSNVTGIVSMAVWPTRTTTWSSGNALRDVYPHPEGKPVLFPVCALALDDFVGAGGPPPDILKIDVEGAELWVLQGARSILKTSRPLVCLEIHEVVWSHFQTTEPLFREFLAGVQYGIYDVRDPHRPLDVIPSYGHAILRPLEGRSQPSVPLR